jgi:nucleoporin NUP82
MLTGFASRSILVGPYHHGSKSSARITKIDWHPLGENNTSLFVLTADGLLREYDPTVDAEEPLQTLSFLPLKSRIKRSNTFGANGPDYYEPISFAFGCPAGETASGCRGWSDWTPLTVYGLMRSGEIFALCPVIPTKAYVAQFLRVPPITMLTFTVCV